MVARLAEALAVSIIIPCLNEKGVIGPLLESLQSLRSLSCEILLVDGGSTDGGLEDASSLVDHCLETTAGRALQMNFGARHSRGQILWFLHADSVLDIAALSQAIADMQSLGEGWGRARVRLSAATWQFRVIETFMEWRSRLTGIATGDQGIFVQRKLFFSGGGFADIPLMEDIALSKTLRKVCWPTVLDLQIETSSRRWEQRGLLRTVLLMWRLRLAYFLGVSPAALARQYR